MGGKGFENLAIYMGCNRRGVYRHAEGIGVRLIRGRVRVGDMERGDGGLSRFTSGFSRSEGEYFGPDQHLSSHSTFP